MLFRLDTISEYLYPRNGLSFREKAINNKQFVCGNKYVTPVRIPSFKLDIFNSLILK